ncbi:MAG: FadR/GntR family transcriptional regulator [Clostridiaceae bacterium]|nr:FadR/GntR family transcriptional regulator [Clostridiaceae bacterium]
MQFERIEPPNLLQKIISQIKYNISIGELQKGSRLPSERALCGLFGLSRATVREALKMLELLGLVECRHGSGYSISTNLGDTLSEPLSIMFLLEKGDVMQTHELRRALELEIAGLAACSASPEDLKQMTELLEKIEGGASEQQKADYDRRFHYTMARAAGNPLLMILLNAAEDLIDDHIHDARIHIIQRGNNESVINRQHRAMLEALRAHDATAARAAVTAHMDLIAASLQ